MESPHGRHVRALGLVGLEVDALERQIEVLRGSARELIGATMAAVGYLPRPGGPAAMALEAVELISQSLEAAVVACEKTKEHLNNHTGEFL